MFVTLLLLNGRLRLWGRILQEPFILIRLELGLYLLSPIPPPLSLSLSKMSRAFPRNVIPEITGWDTPRAHSRRG